MDVSLNILLSGAGIFPSLTSVLLHLLNLIVLTAVLTYFVYRPVKKAVAKRQETAQRAIDENAALKEESEKLKAEFEHMNENAREAALTVHQQVVDSANRASAEIMNAANKEAREIIESAKAQNEKTKQLLQEQIKEQITRTSLDIASGLIGREITAKENDALIEKSIESWEQNEREK